MNHKQTHLGIRVDLKAGSTGVKGRNLRDVVVLAFTLLLLKLERDAANGALLDTLHQVSGESSDLVAQPL